MNLTKKLFLRKCQFPMTLALGVFPLPVVINSSFAPELLSLGWIFPVIYTLMAVFCMVTPGKLRIWVSLAGVGLLCLPAAFLPGPVVCWIALGQGLFYGILLICSLPIAKWTETDELSVGVMWTGLGLHMGAQMLILICNVYDHHEMDGSKVWLIPTLLLYVLLAMLTMNRRGLYSASTGRQKVPTTMRRKNLLMVLLLFGGAALLAALPAVGEFVQRSFSFMGGLVMLLILLLEPDTGASEPTTTNPTTTGGGLGLGVEGAENPIMETLFMILAYTAFFAAVIFVILFLANKCRKWFPKLWKRLAKHLAASSEDYVDEVTSTREFGVQEKRKKKEEKAGILRQHALSPRQQIRSRYRTVLKKHPEWDAGSTAREKLPEAASPLYERARYSDHDITEEEAKKFREDTKKV